jgi:hypothetical protein
MTVSGGSGGGGGRGGGGGVVGEIRHAVVVGVSPFFREWVHDIWLQVKQRIF